MISSSVQVWCSPSANFFIPIVGSSVRHEMSTANLSRMRSFLSVSLAEDGVSARFAIIAFRCSRLKSVTFSGPSLSSLMMRSIASR